MRGQGRGGRNSEFALALAIALDGRAGIFALAADTDGIDGGEDNAGAIVAPDTLARAARSGSIRARGSTTTIPIRCSPPSATSSSPARRSTNVDDFRAILIERA